MSERTAIIEPQSKFGGEQEHTIKFLKNGVEVGCFDFGKSPPTFTGDADASAKLFVEQVLRWFPQLADRQKP